jgi:hypothetical protein
MARRRSGIVLSLDPPAGPIKWKYNDFVMNDDFPEIGFVGPFSTAKSTAAVDRLARRGIEYPGSNILIARGTLTSLKDSTIDKLRQRVGALFEGRENLQEAIFRFPAEPHPVTGVRVESVVNGIGLDRADLERVLKSTEYSTVHLEEADEIPSDAHDMVQERARQETYHRSLVVRDLCMDLAMRWSQFSKRTLTWEDVYQILLNDPLGKVGEKQMPPDHPMPGWTVVSATWNPAGNDHTWARYVGVPYPYPAPDEKWVRDNVGIREVHIPSNILKEDRFRFRAGSLATLKDGRRSYTAGHDVKAKQVILADGERVPEDQATLVVQRYCIYAFGWENESRDHRNVENSYLMANQELRKRHQHGHVDARAGRVMASYIDESVDRGGHVLPQPSRERIGRSGNLIVGGIDHGGDHATAVVLAMYLPKQRSLVFFDEMVKSGQSAYANAVEAQQMMVPGCEHIFGYDPAMNARTFDKDSEHRIIDNYIEVLGDVLFPGARGDAAFDELAAMLERQDDFMGRGPMPRIFVTENCTQIRKTFLNLTWEMVHRQRQKWMVDVGDATKIAVSLVKKGYVDQGEVDVDLNPRLAFSSKFKEPGGAHGRYES